MLKVVHSLYEGLFEDLWHLHPSIQRDLSRDLSRLREAGLKSGLKFYTLTLPLFSKYLLGSLESGALLSERPPLLGAKSSSDKRPRFLWGLWSSIFEEDGTLSVTPDIQSIRSIYQVGNLVKKLRIECDERYKLNAFKAFEEIEKFLPESWDRTWDHDDPYWCARIGHPIWGAKRLDACQADMFDNSDPVHESDRIFDWEGFRNFVARFSSQLGDLHSTIALEQRDHRSGSSTVRVMNPKHGPGAVSDRTDHTKYDGKYWTHRLESVFPYDYWNSTDLSVPDYLVYREFASRLMAVPKDQKGPRLIAAEPTCHQWIQGLIQRWFEDRLKQSLLKDSIDFRRQDLSQDLVLSASLTKSHATIDLSSASDRLTTRLVEYCFQGNRSLLDALHACRTRCVEMPDGSLIKLRKFSTQGSAVTFPVQSIVFGLLAVWAVGRSRGSTKWEDLQRYALEVRVFGDDIIVPNDAYGLCTLLLEECKLKVNANKSFSNGSFRESCGMDAYAGEDVTPGYVRELYRPTAVALESVVECSNNLHMKGWWRTAAALLKTVPYQESRRLLIKEPGNGAFALVSYCGRQTSHLDQRWNEATHNVEVKAIFVRTKVRLRRGIGNGDLLQFFVEEPDIAHPYEGGQVLQLKHRKVLEWVVPDYL